MSRNGIRRSFAHHWPEIIGCFLLGLPLLGVQVYGQSWQFHTDLMLDWYARVYGWPAVHARRSEWYDLGSSVPVETSPVFDINPLAMTLNIIASIVVLAAAFATIESVRASAKSFQFSLSTLLTFVFVVGGVCGFIMFDQGFDVLMGPRRYVPLTACPMYVSVPLMAGIVAVLYAAVMVVAATGRWALGLTRPKNVVP
jgi:hypothetical protein